jgi:hypothetical protein
VTLALLILATCALWAWAGFEVCRATHRQRGTDVDPLSVVLPELDPQGADR